MPDLKDIRFARAAIYIYESSTLEDRHYDHYALMGKTADYVCQTCNVDGGQAAEVTFDAFSWLVRIDLVWIDTCGHLSPVIGATSELFERPGWTRVAAWHKAKDALEFVQLASDWVALEEGDDNG